MCLTDVYPLKNCVLRIYHGSSAVLTAKNSAAFSKAGTLLWPSQFPGEKTEGHKWGLTVWGSSLSHTSLFARPVCAEYSMGTAYCFFVAVWLMVLILGTRWRMSSPQMNRRPSFGYHNSELPSSSAPRAQAFTTELSQFSSSPSAVLAALSDFYCVLIGRASKDHTPLSCLLTQTMLNTIFFLFFFPDEVQFIGCWFAIRDRITLKRILK